MAIDITKASVSFVTELATVEITKATVNFVTETATIDIPKASVSFVIDIDELGPAPEVNRRRQMLVIN